ncbi:unnamed protein product [Linum tenue]|uniref:Haloacid dehalogenase-like hydrolase family protein n=1 Tax=Linum tenue TaxID=586396 RepID=A0AAV0JHY2_9ROSI|nr:unnamed protein product [Linum tenue]
MLPRVRPLLRFSLPLPPPMAPPISSRAAAATLPIVSLAAAPHSPSAFKSNIPSTAFAPPAFFTTRCFHAGVVKKIVPGVCAAAAGGQREYRKVRRRATAKSKQKELELSVSICIEEDLPDNDSEILSIAELLRLNVPMALKLALDGLKDSRCKTRDTTISDVGGYESIELSVMLCNDSFIRKLNKEWRGEDSATDVLSMSQHVPRLNLPILMLGDIVISVETAARQAEERGHTLLDEILILMVHGLLHLLGFDHEISDEAETEMEKEEEILLKSLGWTGKGLIQSAYDSCEKANSDSAILGDRKKEGSLRFYKPKFKYIFCDMDGTLLNSKSQLSTTNANALKEAMSRGVKVVIATGKARPAVINILKTAGLADKDGIVLEASPGVFLQGLLVYGRQGREIFRRNLDPGVCREAEVMPSVEDLIAAADIQKMLFIDTADRVATELRPYWSEAAGELANVVQAVPHMLEIVPVGTSKGSGIQILLDHLGVKAEEIMAIGDGENDIEMLQLAALGIALSNGVEKTKAVADVIGVSNDEDGVADAIYRYAF